MKKSLIALAALAAVAAAQAQESSVTFYGLVDVAMGTINHSLSVDPNFPAGVNPWSANTAPNHVYGMFNGGISDSRWGVKGMEDLGGGMKAFFTLESGINLPDGALNNGGQALSNNSGKGVVATTVSANTSLNGQLFNRQANVGLSDKDLGSVQFGRNYAPIFDIVVAYDPVQAAQLFSPLGFSGTLGGGGGASEDTRVDNSIKYGNKIGDFNFGAMYKLGGQAGNHNSQSAYAVNVGYEANGLGVQFAYQQFKDAMVASAGSAGPANAAASPLVGLPLGSVKVTVEDTQAYFIAAKYAVTQDINVKAGFEQYQISAPSDYTAANANMVTSYYGLPGYLSINATKQAVNVLFGGADWNVMPQLNLAIGAYDVKYDQPTTSAVASNGDVWSLSFLADYRLSKRTDVYAGYMYDKYTGPKFTTVANENLTNYIAAVGIRHKF